jgi:transcriptional regulator with XRE-family HTH domain
VTELHRILVDNMKRLRSELGISQMELAARAELSSGYVGEIEMGRKYPAPEVMERIASALGVKPYRLLMGEDDVAEWLGGEAYYAATEEARERLRRDIDELFKRPGPTGPGKAGPTP